MFWGIPLVLFFLPTSPLSAQTPDPSLRLITSPLPISLTTEPGKTITTELKVKNGGTQEESLSIDLMKFRAYEDSGKPELLERTPEDTFLTWVTFSEPTFTLAPDEWKTITATFTIPEEAALSYYYTIVFSRTQDTQVLAPKQTAVIGGTAILVLLEVSVPGAIREVNVTHFSVEKRFSEFLPTTFRITLENTGNVHSAPRGNIFIDQGETKDIAILEVNSEKGNILPASTRLFTTEWTDGFPIYRNQQTKEGTTILDENNQPQRELHWDWNNTSKLRFGKYQATLLLIYDDGLRDVPITGTLTFWVVPWRMVLGVVFVLVFFLIGIRSTIRDMWYKIFKKSHTTV